MNGGRWAIYARHAGDEPAIWSDVRLLLGVVEQRAGIIAGVYADHEPGATPELAVMLGHALEGRIDAVAVADVAQLGDGVRSALMTAVCLADLGVRLYACTAAGSVAMTLPAVGRELGAGDDTALDLLGSRVGLAEARRAYGTPPLRRL